MSRRGHDRRRSPEDGAVLVAVLGAAAVLAVVTGAAVNGVVALVRATETTVAREQALHAAETVAAAVLDRLDRDAVRWSAVDGPDPAALSHGWRDLDAALLGTPVPPVATGTEVRLTLERDGQDFLIRSEARIRGQARAVRLRVRPWTAADVAWAAEHAVLDPAVTGGSRSACGVPRWAGPIAPDGPVEPGGPSSDGACRRTRFDGWLEVVGPLHLDDQPRLLRDWAPQGPFTTAYAAPEVAPVPHVVAGDDGATVPGPFGLAHGPPLLLPEDPTAGLGDAWRCTLRGPTLIRFDGVSVRIRSPRSHSSLDGPDAPDVLCPGLDRDELTDRVIFLPPDPAVFVVRRDPAARCAAHPLGIPADEDAVAAQRCGDGTAYVWGTTAGARTVIAEDDVQVVWDVGPDLGPDVGLAGPPTSDGGRVGLVAGGSVVLRRPVGPPLRVVAPFGTDLPFAGPGIPPFGTFPADAPAPVASRWESPRITAALVALGGSVRVQNPDAGSASDVPIRVVGSVVQRFVGPTGWEHRDGTGAVQGRSGRTLRVVHDASLGRRPPPGLPRLGEGRLRVVEWAEVLPGGSGGAP